MNNGGTQVEAVFVGTSAGGVAALQTLFERLNPYFSLPIVVTQHIRAGARLNLDMVFSCHQRRLTEAIDKIQLAKKTIFFAPPDYHLLIEKDGSLALNQDRPVHFARPSIDVMFESAAANLGKKACGILLTGANEDGAAGLEAIQQEGGVTMVQSPEDAEFPTMPDMALRRFKPHFVGTLKEIAKSISDLERQV